MKVSLFENLYRRNIRIENRNKMFKKIGAENIKKNIKKMFVFFINIFNKNNIKVIPWDGTLLGIVRDKDIICFDDDLDLLLDVNDFDKVEKIIIDFAQKDPNRYDYFVNKSNGYLFPCRIYLHDKKTEFHLDCDFYSKENKQVRILYNIHISTFFGDAGATINKYNCEDFFPLREKKFLKKKIFIPSNYHQILELRYGKSWNIPLYNCRNTKKCICKKNKRYKYTKKQKFLQKKSIYFE